jgi:hypothetical protein
MIHIFVSLHFIVYREIARRLIGVMVGNRTSEAQWPVKPRSWARWRYLVNTPGLHFVGGVAGFALQVSQTGARSCVLRVMVGCKRREMGLGGFPDVTLAASRDSARGARAKIKLSVDPIDEAKAARSVFRAALASRGRQY